jgi:hypothetical protein
MKLKPEDSRPPRHGWAPGGYVSDCVLCHCNFVGDKRAWHCADCAYTLPETVSPAVTLKPEEKMKTITLTDKQYYYLLHCLKEYGDVLGNDSCNDLSTELEEMFHAEGEQIAREFAVMNNPENPEEGNWPLPDFCLLYWLVGRIKNSAEPSFLEPPTNPSSGPGVC